MGMKINKKRKRININQIKRKEKDILQVNRLNDCLFEIYFSKLPKTISIIIKSYI